MRITPKQASKNQISAYSTHRPTSGIQYAQTKFRHTVRTDQHQALVELGARQRVVRVHICLRYPCCCFTHLVLSPKIDPPDSVEEGSTERTATRSPASVKTSPNASIKVLLPAPGGPERPMRNVPWFTVGDLITAPDDSGSVGLLSSARVKIKKAREER